MSEPKLISPLLDKFAMGDPVSNHHGVRCCPAMDQETEGKYIVKIISVPASQVQLEALLLAGAYPNEAAALSYFKELCADVEEEVGVLNKLAKLEGFVSYEGCQTVLMENEVGYDVYLLSPYRRSLERFFRSSTMTHLAAVNLGLDMCASLAVCRQLGYLYVDLKPDNIFISDDHTYRIGDLGFMKLSNLKYASLPDKYRSAYTAPEIADAFASINTTIDVYAAGMILYQAYNGGALPQTILEPGEPLTPPLYADYEMAEIILKACDPDPEKRWQNPIAMGQALVSYMQRNGANDDPIVPPPANIDGESQDATEPFEDEPAPDDTLDTEQTPHTNDIQDEDAQICLEDFAPVADPPEEVTVETESEQVQPEASDNDEDELTNLSFLDLMDGDETLPDDETVQEISYRDLTDDACDILAQADELIAHEAPEPVVTPEPVEIPIPEPIATEEFSPETAPTQALPEIKSVEAEQEPESIDEDDYDEDEESDYEPMDKKTGKKIVAILLTLILLGGLLVCGYMYYKDYYLQTVSNMTLEGIEDRLIVSISTDVDESLLQVVCTDVHGNKQTAPVVDGVAVFTGLNPNTHYTVKVEVSGLRKLVGDVSNNYTTPNQTSIVSFTAVTGSSEGSVILSFTIDGTDADSWTVDYSAPGEDLNTLTFSGHMASVDGLAVGKTYTFELRTDSQVFLLGNTVLEHTVTAPVYAQDLMITGTDSENLSVSWRAPEGVAVETWNVHCYNDSGYDQTITVSETSATFSGIDSTLAYTVEVTAQGMSAGSRCYMSQNAVTLNALSAQLTDPQTIRVSWTGAEQSNNWLVIYSAAGFEPVVIRTGDNSAQITPVIPGARYEISVQLENGTTVIGGNTVLDVPQAEPFDGNEAGYIVRDDVSMQFSMCKRPANNDWSRRDLADADYTTAFAPGEQAGFVIHIPGQYNTLNDTIRVLFVIRNEEGVPVLYDTAQYIWREMWYQRYCELNIPVLPDISGSYTLDVYFNGGIVHTQEFTIEAQ